MTRTTGIEPRPPAGSPSPPGGRSPVRAVIATVLLAAASTVVAGLVLLPDLVGLDDRLPFAASVALRLPLAVAVGLLALTAGVLALRRARGRASGAGTDARRPVVTVQAPAVVVPVVVPALVIAGLAAAIVVPRGVAEPPPPPGGTELTVLAFNTFEGKADPGAVAAAIARARPDLVVLPESGEPFRRAIAPLVPGYRSWTNVAEGTANVRGIVVLASPRAGDVTARRLTEDTRYPWVEVTGGLLGDVRLVGVHLVSIVPSWISYWPGELALLRRWCAGPAPALVVGDFNATADHSSFRAGTAGCADAAARTGDSLVGTWPARLPAVAGAQIDHVLTRPGPDGRGPQARSTEILDLPGSDHRGLLVRLRLP